MACVLTIQIWSYCSIVKIIEKDTFKRNIVNVTLTNMDTLDGMKTIVAVVETGSFTAAGERLDISKALVSKYVGEVEDKLGARLFNRSTRRLAVTEAGKNYYDRVLPLLEEYTELVDDMAGEQAMPKGTLHISAPVTFGESHLSPLLADFVALYPQLSIDLRLTDRKIDMLQEGVDVVVRIGGVDDSSLIARKIRNCPLVLCASPAYLEARGAPQNATDLLQHCCIVDSNFRVGNQWPFTNPHGEAEIIEVESKVAVNSPRAVTEIAANNGGIALITKLFIEKELASGALVPILTDYKMMEFGMFAIYPHRRYVSKKVRAFVDFMYQKFA